MLKLITIFIVLVLAACAVDNINSDPPSSPDVTSLKLKHTIDPTAFETTQPEVCSGDDCYTVIVNDAYVPLMRPDGSTWDLDGTLPELYVVIVFEDKVIGMTTTLTSDQYVLYTSGDWTAYRARWNEAVATLVLHDTDTVIERIYDDSGYLVAQCPYQLLPPILDNGAVACFQSIASMSLTFARMGDS